MRIRVVRNFGVYKEGQVFDWADGMARLLVARGMIEPIPEPAPEPAQPPPKPPVVEEAAAQPDVERAVDRHTRRPRK